MNNSSANKIRNDRMENENLQLDGEIGNDDEDEDDDEDLTKDVTKNLTPPSKPRFTFKCPEDG